MNKEEINRESVMLESFTRYAQEVADKATASEISRLADDLHARATALQDMTLTSVLASPHVHFSALDIVDALAEDKLNIVGRIAHDSEDTGSF